MYSELVEKYGTRAEIAKHLCERCNELGKMRFDENGRLVEDDEYIAKHA